MLTIRRPNIIAILASVLTVIVVASGCATKSSVGDGNSAMTDGQSLSKKQLNPSVGLALSTDREEPGLETSWDSAEPTEKDLFENIDDSEFCKDNIYAQYLRDQYLKENRIALNPERAFKPSNRGRRKRVPTRSPYDAREVEALFYARSRMVGETFPYYGGIPVVTNPRVEHWVRYFKNSGRNAFLKWLVRGESVKDVVVPILKKEGLPGEFIFLSMVESGFSNSAYSGAKATGPWQFMPGTAKLYGLSMNVWIDERRDPAKSTQAAARLLRDLYREFGDWYLAMAAYNAGPGRVRSAIRQTGSRDFWVLADSPYLPVETKNYVPKVLAALMLSSNPMGHGFDVVGDPFDVLPVSQVTIKQPVAILEIAQRLGVPEKLLRHWNPELVNAVSPPGRRGSGYSLRLSPEHVQKWPAVSETLSYLEFKDVLMHRIRKGETLGSIASRYRVNVKKILNVNPGLSASRLKVGSEVAVPTMLMTPKQKSSNLKTSATGVTSG